MNQNQPRYTKAWDFFAYCPSGKLISILVEVIEAVRTRREEIPLWRKKTPERAWNTVTVGAILRRCYCRQLLVQPVSGALDEYREHVLYILAATELLNCFFKSKRLEHPVLALATLHPNGQNALNTLLHCPLSTIVKNVLYSKNVVSPTMTDFELKNATFHPTSLNIQTLIKIGSLKVSWTEYMDEHFRFDPNSMTIHVYWFASHINGSNSYQ